MPLVRLDGGVFAWSGGRVRFQRDFEGAEWKGRVNPATGATRSHAQGLPEHGEHGEDRAEGKG